MVLLLFVCADIVLCHFSDTVTALLMASSATSAIVIVVSIIWSMKKTDKGQFALVWKEIQMLSDQKLAKESLVMEDGIPKDVIVNVLDVLKTTVNAMR